MFGLFASPQTGVRVSYRSARSRRVAFSQRPSGLPEIEGLEDRIAPAVATWTGGGADALWTDAANWGGTAPVAGDDLVFPSVANETANNDFPADTSFNSIAINASGYTLTGNSVTIATGITADYVSGTSTDGIVTGGAATLTKSGGGTLILSAANTYTGATTVNGGILQVDGSQPGSAVSVAAGSTLAGTGTVGAVTSTGGIVSPGDAGPGVLSTQGDVSLDTASTYTPELNGTSAGAGGYDQLNVTGAVNLGGSTLTPSLGFTPSPGSTFTIIQSTSPITGTFNGLPEGASLTIGSAPFTISYAGNSVTLTASNAAAAPTVTGITPNSGPEAGGTSVTITGTGFTGATAVNFGTTAATGVTVVDDNTITATSPAGTGLVDVTVTTPSGTSAVSPADQFTFTAAAAPTVTGISPTTGPATGGTSVTITGTGFTGATAVNFGTAAATGVTVVDDNTITATSPAGTGLVDVTVVTPSGTSPTSSADQFTFTPTVTGISPTSGPAAGGTTVTITGAGFTGATAVNFGTTAATGVTVVDDTTITAVSPAGTGVADVTVVTPSGTSTTSSADQFTFLAAPTVTGISPTFGPEAGGTPVTITGTGFTGATAVNFGTTAATGVTVVNDTTIQAVSPAGTGVADVTVVTPAGTSAVSGADQFTYQGIPPAVVSLQRFGFHEQPTSLVLTFTEALDPNSARNPNNYEIVTLGGPGRDGNLVGHVTPLIAAIYNPAAFTVTLFPAALLDIHNFYQLTVNGSTQGGLKSLTGVPLAGQGGVPGTNYVAQISIDTLAGRSPMTTAQVRHLLAAAGANVSALGSSGRAKPAASHPVKSQRVTMSTASRRNTAPTTMADWYKIRARMMKLAAQAQGLG